MVKVSDKYKEQTQQQWNNDPCGAVTAEQFETGTKEFYTQIDKFRFETYSPWLKPEIKFENYKNKKVLEIGGGLGTDLFQFANAGAEVYDLDLASEHLRLAKRRFELGNMKGNFVLADAEKNCFKNNSFDVVYSFGVLHHTPETQKSIDEAHRVLKPGGEAIIMLYHKNSYFYWFTLFFIKGILKGNLFRVDMNGILSRFVEYSKSGALPLVKVYTRNQMKEMFSGFSKVQVKVFQMTHDDIPVIGKYIPLKILNFIGKFIGWNLLVRAYK